MSIINRDDIARTTHRLLGDSVRDDISLELGNPLTFETRVDEKESESPGMVWVHGLSGSITELDGEPNPDADQQFVTHALLTLNKIPDGMLIYGAPVRVKKRGNIYEVQDLDGVRAVEFFFGLKERAQRSVDISQLDFGLLRPTSPPSTRFLVTAFRCVIDDIAYDVPTIESDDMEGLIPEGANDATVFLIEVDPATRSIVMTEGSTIFINAPHQLVFSTYYPTAISPDRFLVGWLKLYEGQMSIQINDFYHAQEIMHKRMTAPVPIPPPTIGEIISSIVTQFGEVVTADGKIVHL